MADRRGVRAYYRQFEALSEAEVNAQLREAADERKAKALARVPPLDLSRTTWPEFPHPDVVAAVTYAARRGLHRYADREAGALAGTLAARHDLPADRVAAGDGAAQLIVAALSALVAPGDEVLMPWPTYPLYPIAARRTGAAAIPVQTGDAGTAGAVLSAVTDRTRVVCLCNPNDPTGELLPAADVAALASALPDRVVLLVDEALRDYADAEPLDAAVAACAAHPRVLLFRSFSKAWGLAGLRVGYAIGGEGSQDLVSRLTPDLGLPEPTIAGVTEALRTTAAAVEFRRALIGAHRRRIAQALVELGLDAPPSQGNVLWVAGDDGLGGRLERAGIVALAGGTLGAPGRLRITVPHREQDVDRLLRALAR